MRHTPVMTSVSLSVATALVLVMGAPASASQAHDSGVTTETTTADTPDSVGQWTMPSTVPEPCTEDVLIDEDVPADDVDASPTPTDVDVESPAASQSPTASVSDSPAPSATAATDVPQATATPETAASTPATLESPATRSRPLAEETASSTADPTPSSTPESTPASPTASASPSPSGGPQSSESASASASTSPSPPASHSPSPSPSPDTSESPEPSPTPSSTVTTTSIDCPASVTVAAVEAGINRVSLSWQNGDLGAEPEGYYIQTKGPDGVTLTQAVAAPDIRTEVSGLKNGIEYSFTIIAATRHGSAAPSDPVTATPTTGAEGVVAGLIVEFEPGSQQASGEQDVPGEERVTEVDLSVAESVTDDTVLVEFSEPVDGATAEQIAANLTADEEVAWAEPDQFFFTSSESLAQPVSSPTDAQYATDQWNLWDSYGIDIGAGNTTMTDAWSGPRGDGVTVAVIDTGITRHPDLDSRTVAGYDFVSDPEQLSASRQPNAPPAPFDGDYVDEGTFGALGRDDNPIDPGDWRDVAPTRSSTWHGTKMAGLIAAESNDIGITGIAPGARIQPVRALSWRGGLLSDIAASITWASGGTIDGAPANTTPSKVINMSFSVETTCPTTLQDAIDDALKRGSILVASAGNASDDAAKYAPGNCNGVITVGATNREGSRAGYSNFGSTIDISAPGGDAGAAITTTSDAGTTTPTGATTSSDYGTSVAAAHVSAAAAIVASRDPSLTPDSAYRTLTGKDFTKAFAHPTCDPVQPDYACGSGILSLSEALAQPTAYSSSTDRSAEYDATKASRASMADITATGTLMAWVKPQSTAYQTVVLAGNPYISINGSWSGRARDTSVNTGLAVRQGEWQHVAMTWDATTVSVYVDGALAATGASTTTGTHYGHLEISNPTSGVGRFDGDVDEVKVYSSVLTQPQIVTDMRTHGMNSSVSSLNYVGYYDFNYTESSPATIENLVPGAASSTDLTTSPLDGSGNPLSPPHSERSCVKLHVWQHDDMDVRSLLPHD